MIPLLSLPKFDASLIIGLVKGLMTQHRARCTLASALYQLQRIAYKA